MIRHLENILIGVNRWLIILEIGRLIRTLHSFQPRSQSFKKALPSAPT